MFFLGEKHVVKKQQMISAYTCVPVAVIPSLFGWDGTETRKQRSPASGTSAHSRA